MNPEQQAAAAADAGNTSAQPGFFSNLIHEALYPILGDVPLSTDPTTGETTYWDPLSPNQTPAGATYQAVAPTNQGGPGPSTGLGPGELLLGAAVLYYVFVVKPRSRVAQAA